MTGISVVPGEKAAATSTCLPIIHRQPHPEEHAAGVRLEGWATTMVYPTLRDGPAGLLRVRLGPYRQSMKARTGAAAAMSRPTVSVRGFLLRVRSGPYRQSMKVRTGAAAAMSGPTVSVRGFLLRVRLGPYRQSMKASAGAAAAMSGPTVSVRGFLLRVRWGPYRQSMKASTGAAAATSRPAVATLRFGSADLAVGDIGGSALGRAARGVAVAAATGGLDHDAVSGAKHGRDL